jgi:hypothetical protein
VNFPFVDRITSPLTHRFSLGFQRELPGRFKLEVNYVGTRQFNQPVSVDLNAVPARYLSTLPTRDQATIDYLTSNVPNPLFGIPDVTAGMTGATVARQQLLRPYPQYTSISAQETTGKAWYNSVQVSLDRRFANGFTAQASYTYSRTMEALSYLNPTDTELHKVIGAQDRPHVLVVSGLFNLPFGKGRKFGNDWGGLTEILLGGWQFGTLYRTQVGTPLGFGNFLFKPGYTIADVSKSRRQQTGDAIFAGLPPNAAFTNPWFNTEPFETAAAVQLANNIRTQPARFAEVRAPGYTLLDASLSKTISFSDTLRLKLRFQGFNLLNKVNLRPPSTTVTASTFGVSTALNGYPRQFQLGATFEF